MTTIEKAESPRNPQIETHKTVVTPEKDEADKKRKADMQSYAFIAYANELEANCTYQHGSQVLGDAPDARQIDLFNKIEKKVANAIVDDLINITMGDRTYEPLHMGKVDRDLVITLINCNAGAMFNMNCGSIGVNSVLDFIQSYYTTKSADLINVYKCNGDKCKLAFYTRVVLNRLSADSNLTEVSIDVIKKAVFAYYKHERNKRRKKCQ